VAQRVKWLREAEIPDGYLKLAITLPDVANQAVMTRSGLFIFGKRGCGKTVLACHILRVFMDKYSAPVLFIRSSRFVIRAQSSYKKEDGPEGFIARLVTIPCLVLDDLGHEKWSADSMNMLFELISGREAGQVMTVFTSQMTLKEVGARIDSAVASRIAGMTKILELTGTDRRIHGGD